MLKPRLLLASAAFLAAASALIGSPLLSGCGLLTAGVSVPAAFAQNGDLGLKDTIVDDQGAPVDDVLVSVKREYYLWHADSSYPEYDPQTRLANRTFDVPQRRSPRMGLHLPQGLPATSMAGPANTPSRSPRMPSPFHTGFRAAE